MRLATITPPDGTRTVAIVTADGLVDPAMTARARGEAPQPFQLDMLALIEAGPDALGPLAQMARAGDAVRYDPDTVRWHAPVPVPISIRDFSVFETHIRQGIAAISRMQGKEMAADTVEIPAVYRRQPIYYKGNRFTCTGHREPVLWPDYSDQVDFELEFGIYIARGGRDISAATARKHIFGYTIFNDVSARDAQGAEMEGMLGPAKGKDFDTGNVMGPWLVTADEMPDPYDLDMEVRVNGEVWATGHSRDMLHSFEDMIAWVSRGETIYPGEFLGSGTVGNGCGLELDRWIAPGDEVSLQVDGLGTLTNRIGSGQ